MAIQLEDLVARLRLDTSGVGTGLSGLNSSLSSAGDKATAVGKKLTLGVSTPLVGLGIASTKLAATFDQTMRQVSIATDGPSEALSKLAKRMGAETAFSANEAAEAMLELAKGGMTAAQIKGGTLAATMKLASAGGVELADSATYVSNAISAYGLEAKDADAVTVALAGAANASSASVQSLGMGLAQGQSAARNYGLSLQETTGVLALFDSQALKGSDAGTSLKAMLNGLIPTTDKARDAMAEANLNFVDAQGNFVGVANMADQLQKGLGKLTEAQRNQALETIFGSDGMRAATALMRGGEEQVKRYTKASYDQATTTKLANAAMEGTAGAMERASGSIETAGLAIGEVLAPYVEAAAGKIEELANRFTELDASTQGMIVKGAALAAVIGPATLSFGLMASSVSKVIGVVNLATTALTRNTAASVANNTATTGMGSTMKRVAGIGGALALAGGLQQAATEGSNMGNVLSGVAGGAGIGAMFGPIGALVGGAAGGGLTLLAGSFHRTADEAEAARVQLLKSQGFANAKADADTLAASLVGVSNAYGKVTRAAVESSFTGKDGKLDSDIAKLRNLGVSMDTIVSATLGQADAQKIVESATSKSLGTQKTAADAAKAAYDDVADGLRDVVDQSGQVIKNGESLSSDEVEIYKDAWRKAAGAVSDTEAAQRTFNARIDANTGAIRDNREKVRDLSAALGVTLKQYRQWPKEARTRVEADGLPQTASDAVKLIGNYKDLQSFRNIRAIIEATNARLTTDQIETLTKRYNLTPKQVKTLVQAVGVVTETDKVVRLRHEAENTAGTYTVNIVTKYTSTGDTPRGLGAGKSGRNAISGGGGKSDAADLGYDTGVQMSDGFTLGIDSRAAAVADAADKTVKEAAEKAAKAARARAARVGNIIGDGFVDGIAGGTDHVRRAMSRLMDAVEATHNKRAAELVTTAGRALTPLARKYEKLAQDVRDAEKTISNLDAQRKADDARASALAASGGDLGNLNLPEDTDVTATAITTALQNSAFLVGQFDGLLEQLKAAGLSQDALDQLIAKGPEAAYTTAKAILDGGGAAIAEINALQAQIASSGLSVQAKASQTMYDAGVAAQEGLIAGLESQMGKLEEQMEGIARAMVRAIRKALKIKSPSRVLAQVGEYTGLGFAQGIDSTVRAVQRASDSMAQAALPTVPYAANPNVASLAAARAARAVAPAAAPVNVRVFIGDRELTDIVRVELVDASSSVATAIRTGA